MWWARPDVSVGCSGERTRGLDLGWGMHQDECVYSGETCCLSMRVGGHVGGYFSVPQGPRSGGSERARNVGPRLLFDRNLVRLWSSVGAFLPLCPSPMAGPDPRDSKSRYKTIDPTGSHHLEVVDVYMLPPLS